VRNIVAYYSLTGNNKYLAERIADGLGCEACEIKSNQKSVVMLVLLSLLRLSPVVKVPDHVAGEYDRVVLCGPIWMGMLISPLRGFIKKYAKNSRKFFFATCCGCGEDKKGSSFGYNGVFKSVQAMMRGKEVVCEAFPVGLVNSGRIGTDGKAIMEVKLSDENFKGEIKERVDAFIKKIKAD